MVNKEGVPLVALPQTRERVQSLYESTSRSAILETVAQDLHMRAVIPRSGRGDTVYRNTDRIANQSVFRSQADAFAQEAISRRGDNIRTILHQSNIGACVQAEPKLVPVAAGQKCSSVPFIQQSSTQLPSVHTVVRSVSPSPRRAVVRSVSPARRVDTQILNGARSPPAQIDVTLPVVTEKPAKLELQSRVKIHSLKAKHEFNGQVGTVHSILTQGRFGVLLDNDQETLVSLKPENLILILPSLYTAPASPAIPETSVPQVTLRIKFDFYLRATFF